MTKRALIAEPDEGEARKQAAILAEEGYATSIFEEGDLITSLERDPPDVVILRHERNGQSGLALIGRIKKQRIAPGTALVLTTSELAHEAIEKHRQQGSSAADYYIRLPLNRADLVTAAHAVPQVEDIEGAGVEVESTPPPLDKNAPPPLPPKRFRKKHATPSRSLSMPLTDDDMNFVDSVFKSIQHVDPDAPSLKNAAAKNLPAQERKVVLLRETVSDRERKLARLSKLWRVREEELNTASERFEQKEIEMGGLRLKIEELSETLDASRQELADTIAGYGRERRDQYDDAALSEATMIQEVAKKENELNKARRELRKAEEAAGAEKDSLTDKIFEWERAYRELENHHHEVTFTGAHELQRAEDQVRAREDDKRALRQALHARDEDVERLRQKLHASRADTQRVAHAAKAERDLLYRTGDALFYHERHARFDAESERDGLRQRVFDMEQAAFTGDRLMKYSERTRQAQLRDVLHRLQLEEAETTRLLSERHGAVARVNTLERVLSQERALGQAAIAHLHKTSDHERWEAKLQIPARDDRIFGLEAENKELLTSTADLTQRISHEEVEHATQRARADEVEKKLADTEQDTSRRIADLMEQVATLTQVRETLSHDLDETRTALSARSESLNQEKSQREQENQSAALEIERRDMELKDRHARVVELERDAEVAREDLSTQRQSINSRDDRIEELLAKMRDADGLTVRLEGNVERLSTQLAESQADAEAKREHGVHLSERLDERDADFAHLTEEKQGVQNALQQTRDALEAQRVEMDSLRSHIDGLNDAKASAEQTIEERIAQLATAHREIQGLQSAVQQGRSDIDAGNTLIEQLQSRIDDAEAARARLSGELDQLRSIGEKRDAELETTRRERESALGDGARLGTALEAAQQTLEERRVQLQDEAAKAGVLVEERDRLSALNASLEKNLNQTEQRKAHLNEQVQAHQAQIEKLTADIESLSAEKGTLREEKTVLQGEKDRVVERAKFLGTKIDELEARVQQQTEAFDEERDALIADAEQKHRALSESAASELDDARTALGERVAELTEQLNDAETRAAGLAERTAQFADAQAQAERQLAAAESELLNKDEALRDASARLDALQTESGAASQARAALQASVDEMQAALDDKDNEIGERKKWLQTRDARIGQLDEQLKQKTAEIERLTEAATGQSDAAVALQQTLGSERTAHASELERLQNERGQLERTMVEQQGQLDAVQGALAQAEERAQLAAADADAVAQLQSEVEMYRAQAAAAGRDVATLKNQMAEHHHQEQSLRDALAESSAKLEAVQADRDEKTQALHAARAEAEHEIASAQVRAGAAGGQVDELSQKLRKAQQMLARSLTAHDAEKRRADELEISVQSSKTETEDTMRRLEAEVTRLGLAERKLRVDLKTAVTAAKQARSERDQLKAVFEKHLRARSQ